ncbi:MAG: uncharacterized protein A8A55_0511 [Amphiamblys sp. WSBS2006]|nr:MAG: uncharacterized protein A8A55_0511 [Amphiamblys sp. WSBS2006]
MIGPLQNITGKVLGVMFEQRNLLGSVVFCVLLAVRVALYVLVIPLMGINTAVLCGLTCAKSLLLGLKPVYKKRRIFMLLDCAEFPFLLAGGWPCAGYALYEAVFVFLLMGAAESLVAKYTHPFWSVYKSGVEDKALEEMFEIKSEASVLQPGEGVVSATIMTRVVGKGDDSELALSAGDRVDVLSTEGAWWHVRRENDPSKSCFVPADKLKINRRARVVSEYTPENEDVLEANVGELCEVLQYDAIADPHPKTKVRLKGKTGYVPSACLRDAKSPV